VPGDSDSCFAISGPLAPSAASCSTDNSLGVKGFRPADSAAITRFASITVPPCATPRIACSNRAAGAFLSMRPDTSAASSLFSKPTGRLTVSATIWHSGNLLRSSWTVVNPLFSGRSAETTATSGRNRTATDTAFSLHFRSAMTSMSSSTDNRLTNAVRSRSMSSASKTRMDLPSSCSSESPELRRAMPPPGDGNQPGAATPIRSPFPQKRSRPTEFLLQIVLHLEQREKQ
jgi:hypothetical protein